jgi:hypothetical protein
MELTNSTLQLNTPEGKMAKDAWDKFKSFFAQI